MRENVVGALTSLVTKADPFSGLVTAVCDQSRFALRAICCAARLVS